ncbi:helix-turn-helix domain-containing protein [Streptomyces sp. TR06-5]|uniref:helix-turn-helix transcriptional regulator n=1 Tax=unclassified Streptomyces TaxID=2593676 RepID=UPI0039A2DC08
MVGTGIGLDGRSELLYRTLLLRRTWRARELARALGWPQEEVATVLDGLRTEGFAAFSENDATRFRAVEPCITLPALLARRMHGSRSPQPRPADIDRFIAMHERAAERPADGSGGTHRHDVALVVERIVAKVERDVVFLVPDFVAGGSEFSRPVVDMVLRRGAGFRAVWADPVLRNPSAAAHARWLADESVAPRALRTVPVRAMIMDGAVSVVVERSGEVRVVRSGPELERLCALADRLWSDGAPVGQARRSPGPATQRHRSETVLRLLSEGLTDEAIARRLGCSVRTVRNDIASAMAVLDARSRFQAGARAMQVGLI